MVRKSTLLHIDGDWWFERLGGPEWGGSRVRLADGTREEKDEFASTEGFLHTRVVWYKKFWSNLMFFIANHHPLLSIFCAHRHNIFHRRDRFAVLLCQLGVSYFLVELTKVYYSQYDHDSPAVETYYTHPVVLGSSLALIAYVELVKLLIVMPCCYPGECCHSNIYIVQKCCSELDHFGLALVITISILLTIIGYALPGGRASTVQWAVHTVTAWLIGILTDCLKFIYFWHTQKLFHRKRAYPLPEFPSASYLNDGTPWCCSLCIEEASAPADDDTNVIATPAPGSSLEERLLHSAE